eukprot:scaffold25596_cov74-Cyclotella_meneghiniana.AAC.4
MKCINLIRLVSILLASSSRAFGQSSESNLRGIHDNDEERNLQFAIRKEGWLTAHNTRRESYHTSLGGTYVPLSWSNSLRREAAKYARKMSKTCTVNVPTTTYGINTHGRTGSTNLPVTEMVVKNWEKNIENKNKNSAIVQALWSKTQYMGCADSYNEDKKCSVSVCLYAKAGNCNMHKYAGWEDAIMNGPGCGSCPSDFPDC